MPNISPRPTKLPTVFVGSQAVAAGLLSPSQLRGPLVHRVLHGVYRPSWVPLTHRLKCQAAALILPEGAAITGKSAASVRGVELAKPDDPVEIRTPVGVFVSQRQGISVRESTEVIEPQIHHGIPLAQPLLMAFDLAARSPIPDGVAALDATIRAGHLTTAELEDWLITSRANNVLRVRECASLIDPRAGCIAESLLRVRLAQHEVFGIPNYPIRHDGRIIARATLGLPSDQIALFYRPTPPRWRAAHRATDFVPGAAPSPLPDYIGPESIPAVTTGRTIAQIRRSMAAARAAGWRTILVTDPEIAEPAELIAYLNRSRTATSAIVNNRPKWQPFPQALSA